MNDWFKNKLIVSSFPTIVEVNAMVDIDAIINCWDWHYTSNDAVQDYKRFSTNKTEKLFCPIEPKKESTLIVLDKLISLLLGFEEQDKKVLLHCRSGLHRSVAIRNAYHFLRFDTHEDNGINMLLENCSCKHNMFPITIPQMEKFLREKRK